MLARNVLCLDDSVSMRKRCPHAQLAVVCLPQYVCLPVGMLASAGVEEDDPQAELAVVCLPEYEGKMPPGRAASCHSSAVGMLARV